MNLDPNNFKSQDAVAASKGPKQSFQVNNQPISSLQVSPTTFRKTHFLNTGDNKFNNDAEEQIEHDF